MSAPGATEQKVKEIIARVLKVPIEQVRTESRFRDDLGSDSLDLILLLYEMEDQLEIKLSDDEAKQIHTVGDAIRLASQVAQK
jgi:acyl carrier protein